MNSNVKFENLSFILENSKNLLNSSLVYYDFEGSYYEIIYDYYIIFENNFRTGLAIVKDDALKLKLLNFISLDQNMYEINRRLALFNKLLKNLDEKTKEKTFSDFFKIYPVDREKYKYNLLLVFPYAIDVLKELYNFIVEYEKIITGKISAD